MLAMNWHCFELWRLILACLAFIFGGAFIGSAFEANIGKVAGLKGALGIVLICVGVVFLVLETPAGGG